MYGVPSSSCPKLSGTQGSSSRDQDLLPARPDAQRRPGDLCGGGEFSPPGWPVRGVEHDMETNRNPQAQTLAANVSPN
jgi:hypothetical protein